MNTNGIVGLSSLMDKLWWGRGVCSDETFRSAVAAYSDQRVAKDTQAKM
jgi:hypothetical protein